MSFSDNGNLADWSEFLQGFAQINAQMVDQLQFALFVDLRKQGHFRISRTTLYQSTA